MQVHLSQYAGFCEGVRRAYEIISSLDMAKAKKPVCILGALVHNIAINEKVAQKGIRNVTREELFLAPKGTVGTLIITAHGTGPDVFRKAKEKNISIIDTTCPKVVRVQKLALVFAKKNYNIVIVGDKEHKEVQGIDGWGDQKAFIISKENDFKKIDLQQKKKIAILSQTTQNEDFFQKAARFIQHKYPKKIVKIFKTTCETTQKRQNEIKELAINNDVILIIGSGTSANSRRLWEISHILNPNSYFIDNVRDIDNSWFYGKKTVGITAGASTPPWIVKEVMEYLSNIS
ncbi:MAG: 4-hydroxy-3-methylbut-2-enyl diphosphate reductase [Candidatus Moraniibacteriota bacterium]